MDASLGSELVHLHCGNCGRVTSLSLQSVEENVRPLCLYCGAAIAVDVREAERDALREAKELDGDVDALGSTE